MSEEKDPDQEKKKFIWIAKRPLWDFWKLDIADKKFWKIDTSELIYDLSTQQYGIKPEEGFLYCHAPNEKRAKLEFNKMALDMIKKE